MATNIAAARLRKELAKIKKDPPPGVIAEPKESDILTWFYALQGPPDTPYEGGVYVGKLKFPSEYPMKPPSILMLTPSARFQVNTRLCMSMSDFHPESWNPLWSVATILQGVGSFMASEELTTGGLKASDRERKRLAGVSKEYNRNNFDHLFEGDMEAAFAEAAEARKRADQSQAASSQATSNGRTGRRTRVTGPRRKTKTTTNNEEEEKDEEDKEEEAEEEEAPKELTEAEIEKRRKKNAKKRAKQKAKKAAAKGDNTEAGDEEVN